MGKRFWRDLGGGWEGLGKGFKGVGAVFGGSGGQGGDGGGLGLSPKGFSFLLGCARGTGVVSEGLLLEI